MNEPIKCVTTVTPHAKLALWNIQCTCRWWMVKRSEPLALAAAANHEAPVAA